jgi:predicted nuclease with TOPRIM domain
MGLTATIMGILGALALASWWDGLDKKVSKQVKDRLDVEIVTHLSKQEERFQEQIKQMAVCSDTLLDEQRQNFQSEFNELTNKMSKLAWLVDNANEYSLSALREVFPGFMSIQGPGPEETGNKTDT